MGLVEYPDSDEDAATSSPEHAEAEHAEPATKRRRVAKDGRTAGDVVSSKTPSKEAQGLPALPAAFHDLYAGAARVSGSDDPLLHGGRKRIVPHVEGNWTAHVYLEWRPNAIALGHLKTLLKSVNSNRSSLVTPFTHDATSVALPLHISLSAPLVLRTENKETFQSMLLDRLRSAIKDFSPGLRGSAHLTVRPSDVAWFVNGERTRSFLVLRVSEMAGRDGALKSLLSAGNAVAREFGLAELYAGGKGGMKAVAEDDDGGEKVGEGSFHISIAWSLDVDEKLDDKMLGEEGRQALEQLGETEIVFHDVKIKLGKDVTSVPFGRVLGEKARR